MEDEHSVVQRTNALALVGVYDGHSGGEAATFLRDHLLRKVSEELVSASSCPMSISSDHDDSAARRALLGGFRECEAGLHRARMTSGATAVVLMLQSGGRALNVAWCGDCRAVLSRGGKAVVLTTDHTCQNRSERERVQREGGEILGGRLGSYLEVTRAFGDGVPADDPVAAANVAATSAAFAFRCTDLATQSTSGFSERQSDTSVIPSTLAEVEVAAMVDVAATGDSEKASEKMRLAQCDLAAATGGAAAEASTSECVAEWQQWSKIAGLTAQPEVASEALRLDDEFVILASDGLWDVLSPEAAVKAARAELRAYDDASMAAEKLVQIALNQQADDNITVAIVRLFAPRPAEAVAKTFQRPGLRLVGTSGGCPDSFLQLKRIDDSFVRVVGGF